MNTTPEAAAAPNLNEKRVGFIGGGRIARIFLQAWARARKLPRRVVVADTNAATLEHLQRRFPSIEAVADGRSAAAQDVVFLAVPAAAVPDVVAQIAGALPRDAILVSLVPKFTIAKLTPLLGGFSRIARANPNAPSVVGAGLNPIVFGAALGAGDRQSVRELLAPLGDCPEVLEEKIEAYAVISAMGPTYLWFQMQALRELARSFGLTGDEADAAVRRMTCGAVQTLIDSGLSATEVMDLVPVKPLADVEPTIVGLYRDRLPALFQKIRPNP